MYGVGVRTVVHPIWSHYDSALMQLAATYFVELLVVAVVVVEDAFLSRV